MEEIVIDTQGRITKYPFLLMGRHMHMARENQLFMQRYALFFPSTVFGPEPQALIEHDIQGRVLVYASGKGSSTRIYY